MYYERNLPHWHPEGRAIFVTWRLYGSLPEHIIVQIRQSEDRSGRQFARVEALLDKAVFGPLWLERPEIASDVQACILKGSRELQQYALLAYVIMPNHVHLLVEPRLPLRRIMSGIKGTSAFHANRILRRSGQHFGKQSPSIIG
jgi:putative transposase